MLIIYVSVLLPLLFAIVF